MLPRSKGKTDQKLQVSYKKRVTVIRGKHRNPTLISFPGLLNAGEGGKSRRNVKPAWKTPEQKNDRLQEMGPVARAHPGCHSPGEGVQSAPILARETFFTIATALLEFMSPFMLLVE